MKKIILSILSVAVMSVANAQFTPNNIVVVQVGTGTGTLVNTGNPVIIREFSASGTQGISVPLPTTASGADRPLILSGTSTSEGQISLSLNQNFLTLTGYGTTVGGTSLSATSSATVPRVIGTIDANGVINTTTALTDYSSSNNPRAVTSNDGTQFWSVGGAGGIRYSTLGATTSNDVSTTVTNIRNIKIFQNQLYSISGSGTIRIGAVGTGTPNTTGQTIIALPGMPTSSSTYDIAFFDLDNNLGADVAYVVFDDVAGITKYTFVAGSWTSNGVVGVDADDYRSIIGRFVNGQVELYASRKGGSAATGGGELVKLIDASGIGGVFTASPTILATAATNTSFRGIAFTPGSTPLPVSFLSFSATASNNAVALQWKTASEKNNSHFTLSRSATGTEYSPIATIAATNANTVKTYTYTDNTKVEGTVYYQLSQTDIDGTTKVLGTQAVTANNGKMTITVASQTSEAATLNIYSPVSQAATIQLCDLSGRNLSTQTSNLQAGNNTVTIANTQNQGINLIRVIGLNEVSVKKLSF